MELSELDIIDDKVVEVFRKRIPPPNDPNSYCEKNWMPVIDQEYTYVKWCNPTEVVQVDPEAITSKTTTPDCTGVSTDSEGFCRITTYS
jgi:hypothetical protein